MRIGLFFGSFNPIHSGHLLIANYMVDFTDMDKIWFVISPQNPFKVNDDLLDEKQRLNLLKLAIEDDTRFEACDIEFSLDRPSYTIHTLNHLSNLYPEHTFVPIIGGDNLQSFHKWKDYEKILDKHELYVYRRAGFHENPLLANHPKIKLFDVPLLNISSTYIREILHASKSIHYLVPEKARLEILRLGLYQ
ncbi:MAG: nicotinate (nicotinamide) nucleotide adenylyltransferase [Bacteroidota bacterium]|jgi:nicotinate-nucleotide adenylyltransferase|nr:nicotinate (nicotinamide) nucleotide adenylyltransferase [Crocinitomicaceae bacterium]